MSITIQFILGYSRPQACNNNNAKQKQPVAVKKALPSKVESML